MRLLKDAYFIAVALNHLAVDVLNSQKAILLVFLAPSLDLSNADIGLAALIISCFGSLTQPLFGLLADRFKTPWLSGGSLLWMAGWVAVAVSLPGRWPITALIIGAFGSAAFHSAGTERATTRGETLMVGRAATAASLFFLFGQAGLSFGPALGGVLLQELGARGVLVLTVVAVPVAMNSLHRLHWTARIARSESDSPTPAIADAPGGFRTGKWVLVAFALLVLLRTTPQITSITFLPKLFQDRGYSPAAYGLIASVYMAGSALGGVTGGFLADRWGRRRTILWTLLAAVVPMHYYPVAVGFILYPLVLLAGAFNGASHSVIVVLAHALLPRRRALASGLALGFMFASGAFGSYIYGLVADVYPLAAVMQTNGVLCLLAAMLSLTLRRDEARGRVVAAGIG